jgi:peptide/nickel transport system substrate-binding protein
MDWAEQTGEDGAELEIVLSRRDLMRRGATITGGLGLLPAILAACGGSQSGSSTAGSPATVSKGGGKPVDQITWAMPSDIAAFDYAFSYDFSTGVVVPCVVEPLLRFSADGAMHPNLAESWSQPDATTFVYKLRKGVNFHDGSTMTADDAAFSLERILDPKLAAPLSFFTGNVKSVDATGPYELTVKLKQPDAIYRYAGAIMVGGVASKKWFAKVGKRAGTPSVGMLGTGPYKFVSWTRGQEIVIERFDDYWNQDRLPKVKRVTVKVLEDESTTIASLRTGDVDGTFGLSGKGVKALSSASNIQVVAAPSYFVHFLGINTQRKPWDDARVRQALSYALDKQGTLKAVWAGYGQACQSPVTPVEWSFEKDTMKQAYDKLPAFGQDLDKAKQLIKDAGAEGASAEILVGTQWQEQLGLATQAAGQQIGLKLRTKKVPLQTMYAAILNDKGKNYDMFIVDWAADVPDGSETLMNFLSTNKVTNEAAYKNPKVDELLKKQNASTDPAERAQLLSQAQEIIVNDQPWIVFYSPSVLMPLNKRLGGYELNSLWFWQSWAADLSGV